MRDQHKLAFHSDQGMLKFTVMPFGYKNASAEFQRAMDTIFQGFIGKILPRLY